MPTDDQTTELRAQIREPYKRYFREIGEYLRCKSRFSLPPHLLKTVKEFVDYQINYCSIEVPEGSTYFRARIEEPSQEKPFGISDMGAPPPGKAGHGRINPEGISYLYLADTYDTAIAEVRPWTGARVSIGEMKTKKCLKVVSIAKPVQFGRKDKSDDEAKKIIAGMFSTSFINETYFSAPCHANDKLAYLATQYISEFFKLHGIDGIQYPSVLNAGGQNITLFDVCSAECINVSMYQFIK